MRFIHLTDTHLGKTEAKSLEREQDFYSSFKQAINYAIDNSVDFVIHSGDFFDTARPSTRTLISAVDQLIKLKDAKIPFYVTAGSHDIGTDDTILTLLEKMNLLVNLSSSRYYSLENDRVLLSGEKVGDTFICGISGKRNNIEKTYELLSPKIDGKHSIFIFHHIISDINEKFSDIPTSLLPKGFDYYAGGHWHNYFESSYDKGKVVYPGSTEYNDLNEMENENKRCFCDVEFTESGVVLKKVPIKTRKIINLDFDCSKKDAEQVTEEIISKLEPNYLDSPILIIKINGKLSKGSKSEINRTEIMNSARERGYLYSKIYIGDSIDAEKQQISISKKGPEEIEREYMQNQSYTENEIKVTQKLINLLGKKLSPEELKQKQNVSIEIIRGHLLDSN